MPLRSRVRPKIAAGIRARVASAASNGDPVASYVRESSSVVFDCERVVPGADYAVCSLVGSLFARGCMEASLWSCVLRRLLVVAWIGAEWGMVSVGCVVGMFRERQRRGRLPRAGSPVVAGRFSRCVALDA